MSDTPRHSVVVRVTHWITALSFLGLVLSGIPILLAHPRLYWGETGSLETPSLIDLPLPFVLEIPMRGPYRLWIHEHKFRTSNGGTIVEDLVHYAVWGGELINALMVSPDLKKIFDYRHRKLVEITGVALDSKE